MNDNSHHDSRFCVFGNYDHPGYPCELKVIVHPGLDHCYWRRIKQSFKEIRRLNPERYRLIQQENALSFAAIDLREEMCRLFYEITPSPRWGIEWERHKEFRYMLLEIDDFLIFAGAMVQTPIGECVHPKPSWLAPQIPPAPPYFLEGERLLCFIRGFKISSPKPERRVIRFLDKCEALIEKMNVELEKLASDRATG